MSKLKQTGLALVMVLWVLSLLTIMAASFALTMRRETTVISAIRDNAVALAVAESGLVIAQQMMQDVDKNMRWQADGRVYSIQQQDAEIRVRVLSENGKIDINKADEALLTSLMAVTKQEIEKQQQLVNAILDWRDKNDLVRINGAEKMQYEDEGLAYHPANKNFQSIDELQMVLGMNNTIFQQLKPLITVYSAQKQVDVKVAAEEVLQVLGTFDQIGKGDYLSQRVENNEIQAEGDDGTSNKSNPLKADRLGNQVYTVISQSRSNDDILGGIQVILKNMPNKKTASSFQILNWQQNYQDFSLFSDEIDQQLATIEDESEH